jgi:hypothetical protein
MFDSDIKMLTSFPLLNGISIPCLASQGASDSVRKTITNVFGGSVANEGLGFLALSFDWQYIGSFYMSLPLVQQGDLGDERLTSEADYPSVGVYSQLVGWPVYMLCSHGGHILQRHMECMSPRLFEERRLLNLHGVCLSCVSPYPSLCFQQAFLQQTAPFTIKPSYSDPHSP